MAGPIKGDHSVKPCERQILHASSFTSQKYFSFSLTLLTALIQISAIFQTCSRKGGCKTISALFANQSVLLEFWYQYHISYLDQVSDALIRITEYKLLWSRDHQRSHQASWRSDDHSKKHFRSRFTMSKINEFKQGFPKDLNSARGEVPGHWYLSFSITTHAVKFIFVFLDFCFLPSKHLKREI